MHINDFKVGKLYRMINDYANFIGTSDIPGDLSSISRHSIALFLGEGELPIGSKEHRVLKFLSEEGKNIIVTFHKVWFDNMEAWFKEARGK